MKDKECLQASDALRLNQKESVMHAILQVGRKAESADSRQHREGKHFVFNFLLHAYACQREEKGLKSPSSVSTFLSAESKSLGYMVVFL
mmetsp:Transcript_31760/g.62902  ORF Transcript_31760/g.62902 Transcript_31760/m.62902 type:complete len:89 (-) Transcript_31760:471-737(-)